MCLFQKRLTTTLSIMLLAVLLILSSTKAAQARCTPLTAPNTCNQMGYVYSCSNSTGNLCCTISATECTSSSGSGGNPLCSGGGAIDTAIGCIKVSDFSTFSGWLLNWVIGIAGGIALLLILYSAFLITTSAGDPKKLQAGQEQLTSAVTGLILVIFSIFILKVIGVDIFQIPGFK